MRFRVDSWFEKILEYTTPGPVNSDQGKPGDAATLYRFRYAILTLWHHHFCYSVMAICVSSVFMSSNAW